MAAMDISSEKGRNRYTIGKKESARSATAISVSPGKH
jgi:hypothetical protein